MSISPSTTLRCQSLLKQWRDSLSLSGLENDQFQKELKVLDNQLQRFQNKQLQIVVFGRVGVGKSSLLNALSEEHLFPTDITHGCTKEEKSIIWKKSFEKLRGVELIDTPGIDEINAKSRSDLAFKAALKSDLILFVLDGDLSEVEEDALVSLVNNGKHVVLVMNRCDQWQSNDLSEVIRSIKNRLHSQEKVLKIELVAASPRYPQINSNGIVRSEASSPKIDSFRSSLTRLIEDQGELLLSLNTLRQADHFYELLKKERLKRHKNSAQALIGKFAAIKASGVAANPLLLMDLATGMACDTALIMQLSKIYGFELRGNSARRLLKRLSIYNVTLGGAQMTIQIFLGILKHILFMTSPFTAGLSLAPAAPIALAQAALAIHTTKLTGRLAAKELLRGSQKIGSQPRLLLRRLAKYDPKAKVLLVNWSPSSFKGTTKLNTLLP